MILFKWRKEYMLFCFITVIISCNFPQRPPDKEHITFNIKGINFGGIPDLDTDDINRINPVNMFEFKISNLFINNTFTLSERVWYNSETNSIDLFSKDQLDTNYTYKINTEHSRVRSSETEDAYIFNLYDFSTARLFIQDSSYFDTNLYDFNFHDGNPLVLRTNASHNIVLNYSLFGKTSFQGTFQFDREDGVIGYYDRNAPMLFNYNAEWVNVLNNNYYDYINHMVNIIVMGEGYTDRSGLPDFRHIANLFIEEIYNSISWRHLININAFRMDTVSLTNNNSVSGNPFGIIGIISNGLPNPFGDSNRIRKILQTSFVGGPIIINSNGTTNIDVIIILLESNLPSYRTDASTSFLKRFNPNYTKDPATLTTHEIDALKDVHIIVMPYNRQFDFAEPSITSHLEEIFPELYDD